ncbi:MAG TPA: hypothetical protein P5564_00720 [Paludibacteraceae bacterium]|nr:hypothetical protein [Paludibacteraceae bacterium]
MKRVVLISCAAKKSACSAPAEKLYQSTLFTKSLAFAKTLKPDAIFILSAKHHLLNLNTRVEPYNVTLNKFTKQQIKEWSQIVLNQLRDANFDLQNDEFTILAGKSYYQDLIGAGKIEKYTLPYKDCKGIGYILKFLTDKLKE